MTEPAGPPPIETGNAPIPRWLVAIGAGIVLVAIVALGGSLEGTNPDLIGNAPSMAPPPPSGEPPPSGAPPPSDGGGGDAVALIEQAGCQACHGDDLDGQGNFPSLHGVADGPVSENLQDLGASHPDDWANLWIDGTGPEVEGIDRGGMPAFGSQLTPEEIATIVEYLKTL
jgi:mono/diheme cytochrome c family protein